MITLSTLTRMSGAVIISTLSALSLVHDFSNSVRGDPVTILCQQRVFLNINYDSFVSSIVTTSSLSLFHLSLSHNSGTSVLGARSSSSNLSQRISLSSNLSRGSASREQQSISHCPRTSPEVRPPENHRACLTVFRPVPRSRLQSAAERI